MAIIQCQVLNKVIESKDKDFFALNSLDRSYFSDYKDEYDYLSEYIDKYDMTPAIETFVDKFPKFRIFNTENLKVDFLITELHKDKSTRVLIDSGNKIRDLLLANKIDEAKEFATLISESLTAETPLEAIDMFNDTSRLDAYIDKKDNFISYYVTTGFKELDDILGGWDRKGELATIIARSNQGKSWLLLKTAIASAEKGLRVGFYSGEMTMDKVGYRMDTIRSHISNTGLTHGKDEVYTQYLNYVNNEMRNIKGHIFLITPAECGGFASINTLKAFIKKYNLDMLCVDQHSLLEDQRGAKNPIDRAANISRDLKNLQVLTQIPIISACQQNRSSTENGVDLTHIAQSDRIGQDSTVVIAFEQKDGLLTLHIIKARDSAAGGELHYHIDFDKGEFVYSDEPISDVDKVEEYGDTPF